MTTRTKTERSTRRARPSRPGLSRRGFLHGIGLSGAAVCLGELLPGLARAEGIAAEDAPFVIYATFDGGWDQLLALDPRDNTAFDDTSAIHPAYDLVAAADPGVDAVLTATGGSGVVRPQGSAVSFGPAVGALSDHFADLCVVRGLNMGTLTHEVGKRYFLTGKFPRGLSASGSSLVTAATGAVGDYTPIPNLVMGMETYNEGGPSYASGLQVRTALDLQTLLAAIGTPVSNEARAAIGDYVWAERCATTRLDGDGTATRFREAYDKGRVLASGELASVFDLTRTGDPDVQALLEAFEIPAGQVNRDLSGAKGQAAIAAQAITRGISQAVSIQLATGIDHHDGTYLTDHSVALRTGFDALASLLTVLKTTYDSKGRSYFERTVVIASSEFARTPRINSRDGRDHHLSSSCLVTGAGIVGNRVIGGTDDASFAGQAVDLSTGSIDPGGVHLRPPDVHATVLHALGLPYDHLENQDPQLIGAMLA